MANLAVHEMEQGAVSLLLSAMHDQGTLFEPIRYVSSKLSGYDDKSNLLNNLYMASVMRPTRYKGCYRRGSIVVQPLTTTSDMNP